MRSIQTFLILLLATLALNGCAFFRGEPSTDQAGLGGPSSDRKPNPGVSSGADGGAIDRITAIRNP